VHLKVSLNDEGPAHKKVAIRLSVPGQLPAIVVHYLHVHKRYHAPLHSLHPVSALCWQALARERAHLAPETHQYLP
jgi:hypothetical protein